MPDGTKPGVRDRSLPILIDHEGCGPAKGDRLFPYFDCCGWRHFRQCTCTPQGKLTLGFGRNVEDIGISRAEASTLALNDIDLSLADLETFPWWPRVDADRQIAIGSWRYNLGPTRFRRWTATIAYIAAGQWTEAARQFASNRLYVKQTGRRATWIARVLDTGRV